MTVLTDGAGVRDCGGILGFARCGGDCPVIGVARGFRKGSFSVSMAWCLHIQYFHNRRQRDAAPRTCSAKSATSYFVSENANGIIGSNFSGCFTAPLLNVRKSCDPNPRRELCAAKVCSIISAC